MRLKAGLHTAGFARQPALLAPRSVSNYFLLFVLFTQSKNCSSTNQIGKLFKFFTLMINNKVFNLFSTEMLGALYHQLLLLRRKKITGMKLLHLSNNPKKRTKRMILRKSWKCKRKKKNST